MLNLRSDIHFKTFSWYKGKRKATLKIPAKGRAEHRRALLSRAEKSPFFPQKTRNRFFFIYATPKNSLFFFYKS